MNSIAFSPPDWDLTLACASSDGTISVISNNLKAGSSRTGEWTEKKIPHAHGIGCNSVSWAPSLNPLSLVQGSQTDTAPKRFVSGGCDNMVKIWQQEETSGEWIENKVITIYYFHIWNYSKIIL